MTLNYWSNTLYRTVSERSQLLFLYVHSNPKNAYLNGELKKINNKWTKTLVLCGFKKLPAEEN